MSKTAGALAASAWLRTIGHTPPTLQRWNVEVLLGLAQSRPSTDYDDKTETRFHISIYSEEWGVFVCHQGRASWIRVTDVPFVHVRDDFKLLSTFPALKDVGGLLRKLETQLAVRFARDHAAIHTNLPAIERDVRRWVASL